MFIHPPNEHKHYIYLLNVNQGIKTYTQWCVCLSTWGDKVYLSGGQNLRQTPNCTRVHSWLKSSGTIFLTLMSSSLDKSTLTDPLFSVAVLWNEGNKIELPEMTGANNIMNEKWQIIINRQKLPMMKKVACLWRLIICLQAWTLWFKGHGSWLKQMFPFWLF